jgi:hypothetical protein
VLRVARHDWGGCWRTKREREQREQAARRRRRYRSTSKTPREPSLRPAHSHTGEAATLQGPPKVDWISVQLLQHERRAEPVAPEAEGATSFVSCGPPKDGAEVRIVSGDGAPLDELGGRDRSARRVCHARVPPAPVRRRLRGRGAVTGPSRSEITDRLRTFILTELMQHPGYPLGDHEPLMSGGLVDSFCMAHIAVFIETTWGVYIPDPSSPSKPWTPSI